MPRRARLVCASVCALALAACGGGSGGSDTSQPAAPTITTQPQSQTVDVGATATFSVVADGHNQTLSYQWQRAGTAISGATGASYTTAATSVADNGASFTVVVSAGGQSVTSAAATLTVQQVGAVAGTAIDASTGATLSGATVTVGTLTATSDSTGKFTIAAVPVGPRLVVTYQHAGYAPTQSIVTVAPDATVSTRARLTPVAKTQTFDPASGATITVTGSPAQVVLPANGFLTASGGVPSGQVTAEVTPINPYKNPANMPGDYATLDGSGNQATIESFGALTVTLHDAANSDVNLAAGKTATIRIPLATKSAHPPATVPLYYFNASTGLWVAEGTATLAGSAPQQYYEGTVSHFTTWNADQIAQTIAVKGCVHDASGLAVLGAYVGSVGIDYTGSDANYTDASGNFTVNMKRSAAAYIVAEQGDSTATVSPVGPSATDIQLSVCLVLKPSPPVFVVQPVGSTVNPGAFVYFLAQAVGAQPITYQWQKNGVAIPGEVGEYLFIASVADTDQASYTSVATNAYGSTTSNAATLTVTRLPPTIVLQPQSQTVIAGSTATFTVAATAGNGAVSYQWRKNGSAISGATASSYVTPATVVADSGAAFDVVVTAAGQSITSTPATLTVQAAVPPTITTQPASVSVAVGQSASFTVAATGPGTLTYQWRRAGVAIAGAVGATYVTPATTLADNGVAYSVVVTNPVGSVTSANAQLTVTQSGGGAGTYLVGFAGPSTSGTSVTYADGSSSAMNPQALVGVPPNGQGGVTTVEAAGNLSLYYYTPAYEATVGGSNITNLHERLYSYFKSDALYVVDLQVSSGVPTPRVVSTLKPGAACSMIGAGAMQSLASAAGGNDYTNAAKSWTYVRVPGSDGVCYTADDQFRAVRLDMLATDAPVAIGEPMAEVLSAAGAFNGLVVRNGSTIQQLNATLTTATTLFTAPSGTLTTYGVAFGSGSPGIWLFDNGTNLYAYALGSGAAAPTVVTALAAGEHVAGLIAADGADGYVAIAGAASTRVLKVSESALGTPSTVATVNALVGYLQLSPTRVVMLLYSTGASPSYSLASVLKSGGAVTTLASAPTPPLAFSGGVVVAGENVYYSLVNQAASSAQTVVINTDGTNSTTLANTAIVGATAKSSFTIAQRANSTYAVFLATGINTTGYFGGATVKAVEGATRLDLASYGAVQATPPAIVYTGSSPLQYGLPGLLYFSPTATGQNDLYWFNSGTSNSLLKQTHFN